MAASSLHESSPDPKTQFGKHLAALRKKRGFSQEQLALEVGMARSYIGGVERGTRNISLINICRLACSLSVTPSELMNFD
jgi:transcriptional regulator with XRE-family HTH domain